MCSPRGASLRLMLHGHKRSRPGGDLRAVYQQQLASAVQQLNCREQGMPAAAPGSSGSSRRLCLPFPALLPAAQPGCRSTWSCPHLPCHLQQKKQKHTFQEVLQCTSDSRLRLTRPRPHQCTGMAGSRTDKDPLEACLVNHILQRGIQHAVCVLKVRHAALELLLQHGGVGNAAWRRRQAAGGSGGGLSVSSSYPLRTHDLTICKTVLAEGEVAGAPREGAGASWTVRCSDRRLSCCTSLSRVLRCTRAIARLSPSCQWRPACCARVVLSAASCCCCW